MKWHLLNLTIKIYHDQSLYYSSKRIEKIIINTISTNLQTVFIITLKLIYIIVITGLWFETIVG